MTTARPPRAMDPYAAQFWHFTLDKELRLQACSDCGKYRWPPGPTCGVCLSEDFNWAPVSGRGRLISWTTFHREYFPEYPPPHTVIVVELDEGPLFVSTPAHSEVAELAEGMLLQLAWLPAEDPLGAYNLPVFRPAGSTTA